MKKRMSYLGLFFVIFVWGCSPMLTLELYKYYSPSARLLVSGIILLLAYVLLSKKYIREWNRDYLKIGLSTGFFMALANISQKIGLLYTTPAKYAFLENLSCVSVPILMYFFIKKKPTFMTLLSSVTCLFSVFVLNGVSFGTGSAWGIGEVLCAIAGILYGFNIAGTGAFARKLYAPLYLATQQIAAIVVYGVATIAFDKISLSGSATTIEPIVFSREPMHLLFLIFVALLTSALCWTIRTNAMKYVEASTVAIIMPFSSVVTSIISIIQGNDKLSTNFVLGGALGLIAIFMSSYDDIVKKDIE